MICYRLADASIDIYGMMCVLSRFVFLLLDLKTFSFLETEDYFEILARYYCVLLINY